MSESAHREIRIPRFPMDRRPIGLLWQDGRGLRVDTSDGLRIRDVKRAGDCIHAARRQGYVLYSLLWEGELRDHLGDGRVAAKVRHNRFLKLYVDFSRGKGGVPDVRGCPELNPLSQFNEGGPEGVWPWFSWCEQQGVAAASLGQMGWNLWLLTQAGAREPLTFYCTLRGGELARLALVGGRKEAHPEAPGQRYNNVVLADISGAYPRAMAAAPYPVAVQRVPKQEWARAAAERPAVGFALAQVQLPRQAEWGPLPVRIADDVVAYLREPETVTGCWTLADLRLAWEIGARVKLIEAWEGVGYRDLFGRWWRLVQQARELPGESARIAKYAANVLWGRFCMTDEAAFIQTHGQGERRLHRTAGPAPPSKNTAYLAAETAARVRVKLAREGLYPHDAIYCDTDGVMVPSGTKLAADWAVKETMREVEIRASQVYRYTCPECQWNLDRGQVVNERGAHIGPHYSIAGMRPDEDPAVVFAGWPIGAPVSDEMYDVTVPAGPLGELVSRYGSRA